MHLRQTRQNNPEDIKIKKKHPINIYNRGCDYLDWAKYQNRHSS